MTVGLAVPAARIEDVGETAEAGVVAVVRAQSLPELVGPPPRERHLSAGWARPPRLQAEQLFVVVEVVEGGRPRREREQLELRAGAHVTSSCLLPKAPRASLRRRLRAASARAGSRS